MYLNFAQNFNISFAKGKLLNHNMQGLLWFDFHLGMPHASECCFLAKNGAICINTPPHHVWHVLEMVVAKCLKTSLTKAGHQNIPLKV